ncbi:hypothetical protein ACIBO2_52235 [Nonomuraea sp. NPDC050022]|uniref:hypothetical protein n=1 Tax=Nonomuraea sp. NPDC050022 TaxID=3364358 RepID=UPI0037BBF95F
MTESDTAEIRDFRIDIPQADLAERLARVRWTDELPDAGSHFAAHDVPNLLIDDIHGFFRRLR